MAGIVWAEPALADLFAIVEYIAADNPSAAERLVRKVVRQVERLGQFPESGSRPRDLVGTPYRQLLIVPLKIFYRPSGNRILIVHVVRCERRFRISDVRTRDP